MDSEQRLWLIRHAPVARPKGLIHDPDAPADVSDTARFATLKKQLPAGCAVYASPARRTLDTARALGFTPVEEPRLREQQFGAWTGRSHADIEAEMGDAYREFWRAPATNRPPNGESFADQIARVAAFVPQLPEGDSALIVHSGTVRAFLAIALDLTPNAALRFVIDPLSLTRIDRLHGGWRVGGINTF